MLKLNTIIIFFTTSFSFGQINEVRKLELDSLVTNIERSVLKNLDSVHKEIHSFGKTDEERVFMFYGLIATHYKYDMKRFWQSSKNSIEYTPHYTAYKRSGVCRDFSALFKDLCDRSKIPCVEVLGKTPYGFFMGVVKLIKFQLRYPNHAWNLVKYNDTWHHMDPTWSRILKIDKYYEVEEGGNVYYVSKAKRPDRTYYDISYEELYSQRKAVHPALLANDTIYTYKSIKRKATKRKVYRLEYNFKAVLDSLISDTSYYEYGTFYTESKQYSGYSYAGYKIQYKLDFLEIKRTKFNPITIEMCDEHLAELKKLFHFLEDKHEWDYWEKYADHMYEVYRYKDKLIRKKWKKTFS